MANTNFERSLSTWNGSSHPTADNMALTIFSGTVLEAFQLSSVFYDRSSTFLSLKQLNGAISAQWPIIGDDPVASYHTPGTELNALSGSAVSRIKSTQKVITCDEILANAIDVPFRELALLHYEVLGPYATKLGRNIARVLDRKIAILAMKGSTTAALTNVHQAGMNVNRTGSATVATAYPLSPQGAYNFRKDLNELAQTMEERSIPAEGRYLFISPHIKSVLRFEANFDGSNLTSVPTMASTYDRNLSAQPNDVNNRVIGRLDGFNVIVTNNLPSTDLSGSGLSGEDAAVAYASGTAGTGGKYQGNFSGATTNKRPVAVALCAADTGHPGIGMVQAMGMTSHISPDERRNTQFLKAQLMCGLDVLCPWACGSVSISAS